MPPEAGGHTPRSGLAGSHWKSARRPSGRDPCRGAGRCPAPTPDERCRRSPAEFTRGSRAGHRSARGGEDCGFTAEFEGAIIGAGVWVARRILVSRGLARKLPSRRHHGWRERAKEFTLRTFVKITTRVHCPACNTRCRLAGYGYGALMEGNGLFDSWRPILYAVKVTGQRVLRGSRGGETYYLKVAPWGSQVAVHIGVRSGHFSIPWYYVRPSSGRPLRLRPSYGRSRRPSPVPPTSPAPGRGAA